MESLYINGGMIGATLDYNTTEKYLISEGSLSYVGNIVSSVAHAQNVTFTITGLTGGSDSAPAIGDIVIVAIAFRKDSGDNAISCTTAGYTEIADLFANDTYDTNLAVYYKVLTTTETSVSFNSGSTTSNSYIQMCCQVWRGIDIVSPLDVSAVPAVIINTGTPNAPSISTVSANSIILAIGASVGASLTNLTVPSGMSNFLFSGGASVQLGIASYLQVNSGAYDPPAFGGGGTSALSSSCAVTVALRAGKVYGNLKNSGVWDLSAIYERRYNSDPYYANVSLLLHGDGTEGSTTIIDSSPNAFTVLASGNAKISTINSKFGGSSLLFDGTGDWVGTNATTNTAAMDLIGNSFTIECWIYLNISKSLGHRIFSTGAGAVGWGSIASLHTLFQVQDATNKLSLQLSNNTTTAINTLTTATVPITTWTHIAAVYDGANNVKIFINGVLESFTIATPVRPMFPPYVSIATALGEAGGSGTALNGSIDDLRITKGVARYTANFTPSTTPFQDY